MVEPEKKGGTAVYYRMLNDVMKEKYGCKVYKLALSTGCSCPNRENGKKGCLFCDGAGAFAETGSIPEQLAGAKARVASKIKGPVRYISYFQSFTNTYGKVQDLEPMFRQAMEPEDIAALSVATRPDCLGPEILAMLERCRKIKPVWVELGLQTVWPETAQLIRRGYDLPVYDRAVQELKARDITVITHQILGLPGETPEQMTATSRYIGHSGADGIKFHLLHVLRNTDLAELWKQGKVPVLDMEAYIQILERCVESIPREMVIHRLTGDGAKKDLLAPLWSGDKKRVLNAIHRAFREDDTEQGKYFY